MMPGFFKRILNNLKSDNKADEDPHLLQAEVLRDLSLNPDRHVRPHQPAMTSITEQAYCEWYATEVYRGRGAVVELGCWLGSLTSSLAKGLKRNSHITDPQCRINVMDYYKWDVVMEEWVAGTKFAERVEAGGDFQELYREAISDILEMVDITQADLSERRWEGGPIEFLLIDCMKRIDVAANVAESFFPKLIPGSSYVAHQDYLHFFHSWIHILMYQLRESIVPILVVPESSTIVFKCIQPVQASDCTFPRSFSEITTEQIDAAFDWNMGIVDESHRDAMAAAKVSAFVHKGEMDTARRLYREYTSGPYPDSIHFERMYDFFKRFDIVDLKEV